MGTTPTLALPYPELADTADVPRDIQALANAVDAASVLPPGVVQMWPGTNAPTGWFICNGQVVPAASNPKLVALFGASGGNVTLPDLRDRCLVGVSASRALRSTGGAAAVTLTNAQSGMPGHGHADSFAVANQAAFNTNAGGVDHTHGYSQVVIATGPATQVAGQTQFLKQWNPQFTGANTGGASAYSHAHTVPAHGHALNGAVTDAGAQNAASSHENMPPYYAINFIIRGG